MVWNVVALGSGGLGRADVHSPVEEPGIGGDNLAVEAAGQGQREGRLAHGGGTDDDEQGQARRRFYHDGAIFSICSTRRSAPFSSSSTAIRSARHSTSSSPCS